MSAAEAIKKKQISKPTTKTTAKQQHIIEVKTQNPTLTVRQIAKICDTGHSHVVQTLQRYNISQAEVEDFKANRADILAGLQHRLIKSVTEEDIKKAPLGSRVLAAAQLYDKERLEVGKTTSNIAQVIFQMPAPKPVPDHLKMIIEEKNSEDNNDGGVSC